VYKGRIIVIGILVAVVFLILESRLFYLQIIKGSEYREKMRMSQDQIELVPAARGRILDANGEVIARDEHFFELYIVPDEFEKRSENLELLTKLLNISPNILAKNITKIYSKIERECNRYPEKERKRIMKRERKREYLLFEGFGSSIGMEKICELETHPEKYGGVRVKVGYRRKYPRGKFLSHIIGYVGRANNSKEEFNSLLQSGYWTSDLGDILDDSGIKTLTKRGVFDNEFVGKTGIEGSLDNELRFHFGVRAKEEKILDGEKETCYSELKREICGKDILLTIDGDIQEETEKAISSIKGAAIVMDVRDGAIISIASSPSFDPNDFVPPVRDESIKTYFAKSSLRPLFNRAIAGSYPLGSIFKVVIATAGLEEKKITPSTTFTCTGTFISGSKHFQCWIYKEYGATHGELSLIGAIQHSCNIFFFNVGKIAGIESIIKYARMYGFGRKTGIEIEGEKEGYLPDDAVIRNSWTPEDTLNISIGQGNLLVTPLQVVRMMAAVANGGYLVMPHILKDNSNLPPPTKINISQSTLEAIKEGLWAVVNKEGGTAFNSGLRNFDTAGKTSSAQVGSSNLSHGWFCGFAPYKNPRYAYLVLCEFGGSGAQAAAPIAAQILAALSSKIENEKKQYPSK